MFGKENRGESQMTREKKNQIIKLVSLLIMIISIGGWLKTDVSGWVWFGATILVVACLHWFKWGVWYTQKEAADEKEQRLKSAQAAVKDRV